ncbi:uncharacterized protein METZ01_LOCUS305742, partial [marine metagenome]
MLSAFEDGELEGEQLSEFRHRLLQEPELRRELDAIRSTDERLRDYASWIDATPVPEQIAGLVRFPPGRSAAKLFAAAAAVFVLTIGTYLIIPNELDIDYSLLTFMESGQRIDFGEDYLEVVASFQQLDGRYCRELITRDSHQIVCLTGESWQSMIEVSRLDPPADAYQPAGGYVAPIDRYVRDHISGTVIEAAEEKQLIE